MEAQMRPGGRENHPIKIIETSGSTLEMLLKPPAVKQMCAAQKCLARDSGDPKIGCRVNGIGYKLDCKHCLLDGRQSTYIGETGKNGHCRVLNHQSKFRSKTAEVKAESAFYKHIAYAHPELYNDKDELEVHFTFEALKVFKYPLDREVDEGVRMVMHQGVLLNSKTEWFSPSIVRTTIEKGGAEMAHQPARGFRVPTSIHSSASQPPGRSEGLAQPSRSSLASQPTGRSKGSAQPPKPSMASSKPPAPAATGQPVETLTSRDERMRQRHLRLGTH
jgi:hypothetical protein